ncbi:T9SS type A sorting domain-containing protein, partial [candidate division KSB1 bacterium]|nr:T9SS type A sorting domain-containing protein [candidate division KSB1 bacterium]
NPFNMETTISYSLPEATGIKLVIYNTHGQIIDIIDAGQKAAGTHRISWTGRDTNGTIVPSGVYLLKLYSSNPKTIATRKLVLLK